MATISTARHIGTVENLKLIRTALKTAWPKIKFKVTSSRPLSTIYVSWADGPTSAAVEEVTETFECSLSVRRHSYGEVCTLDGALVTFAFDNVDLARQFSPEFLGAAAETAATEYGFTVPVIEEGAFGAWINPWAGADEASHLSDTPAALITRLARKAVGPHGERTDTPLVLPFRYFPEREVKL